MLGAVAWESVTGPDTPLVDIGATVDLWVRGGMPAPKLVLGPATYGPSWTLANVGQQTMGAPATGPGKAQPATQTAGTMA